MEDYGNTEIQKLPQFVTTWNSGKKFSIDLKPKEFENSDNLSFFTAKLYESSENQKLKLEMKFASKSAFYPSKKVTSHKLRGSFLKLLLLLTEDHLHTQ